MEGRGKRRLGRAPDDIEILEFALKWRINPQELREQWDLRDIRWLQLVEEAHRLATGELRRREKENGN